MKIIFLDFDGVLNKFSEPETLRGLSKDCVERLNYLIEKTDANIVVSSVWRILRSTNILKEILVKHGFKYPEKVIGATPRLSGYRGEEISAWLEYWSRYNYEEITSFVILDDDSDMEPFMDRLVQTDSDDGLLMEYVEKAIVILNSEEPYAKTN